MWLRILYRFCYKYADGVIQDSITAQLAGLKYGARKENNKVITCGVDPDCFNSNVKKKVFRKKYKISNDTKIVFSPRSLTPLYNIDIIIQSIPIVKKEIPDVMYIFTGLHTNDLQKLVKLAASLDIGENIEFVGSVNWIEQMKYYYIDSDLVISIPSSDSWPASVLEAMACGIPVIISELPWYKGIFDENEDLVTVSIGDKVALAETTINILNGKIQIKVKSVSNKVHKEFSHIHEASRLESFYEQLISV
jgi:glycosyltransferase involved in cell wall biosynthesis